MENVEHFIEEKDKHSDAEKKKRPLIKTPLDLQRLKLERLMKNPNKPVVIPELPKDKDFMSAVPNFVRNVMGSSAGAGSGEFHVYRHLRRKEYARQKYIQSRSHREQLNDEYREKIEKNRLEAEAKTAKKRAKRLKKKQKQKGKKSKTQSEEPEEQKELTDDDSSSEQGDSDGEKDEHSEKSHKDVQEINTSENTEQKDTDQNQNLDDSSKNTDNESNKEVPKTENEQQNELSAESENKTQQDKEVS